MKTVFLLIVTILLVFSCKKEAGTAFCELHPDECVDIREVKDYFYFKMGSWWVYEEEHTGKRDSVYVTQTWTDTSSVLFETWLHSSYDGYDYTFWTTGVNGSLVTNNMTKKTSRATNVNRAKTVSGDYVGEDPCFLFYPTPGAWTYTYGGPTITNNVLKIEAVHANYTNYSIAFEEVVHLSEQHTAIEEKQPTHHFYAPHIGLIRKELIDSNQVWNLVSYHINQ
jgi:hypothetical protein